MIEWEEIRKATPLAKSAQSQLHITGRWINYHHWGEKNRTKKQNPSYSSSSSSSCSSIDNPSISRTALQVLHTIMWQTWQSKVWRGTFEQIAHRKRPMFLTVHLAWRWFSHRGRWMASAPGTLNGWFQGRADEDEGVTKGGRGGASISVGKNCPKGQVGAWTLDRYQFWQSQVFHLRPHL